MKLWMQLMAAMLLIAVMPVVFLTRYATTYFHHFTREAQEEQMSQAGLMVAELFRSVPEPEERRKLLQAYSERSGRRYRFYDAELNLQMDVGEVGAVSFEPNPDVVRARDSGGPSARWWLRPDQSSLFYFVSVPLKNGEGEVLGVAQVIEDTNRITRALSRLHDQQLGGVWWIAGGCLFFSAGFSWLLTRRLRRLRSAALQFGKTGTLPALPANGKDEVADLARGFRQMAEELRRRHAYNRDFVLTTLHELRTPLTAMHGAADILHTRERLSDEDRKRFAGNIQHQSDRMLGLVKELQTLTSLDVDLPNEPTEALEIKTWLPAVVERLRPGLKHPVEISIEAETDHPVQVIPHRMEQTLANLLNNADRYQPDGIPLQVISKQTDGEWTLCVRDRGPGIEAENLDRIFDRYFSTVPRDQPGSAGRGLGLSVVRRIAEHHRGTVHASNAQDGGAVVGVTIPALRPGT